MRQALLTAALLLGTLLPTLAAGASEAAESAPNAAIGRCSTSRGTIVAVDFAAFHGPIVRGCGVTASGAPDASGFDLLHDGGFTTAGDQHDGPAFVCRLGNAAFAAGTQYPTAQQDPCVVTPPASAYWSFWLAKPGATSWTYSSRGATSDQPVAGEVELWTFGGTDTAGTSGSGVPANSLIGELRANNTTVGSAPSAPRTTAAPTTGAPGRATASTSGPAAPPGGASLAATSSPSAGQPSSTGGATGRISATSSSSSPATTVSEDRSSAAVVASGAGDSPSGPPVVAADATPSAHHSAGSPLPVVLAAVLVALLAAGAGFAAWQRRRGTTPSRS